MDIKLNSIICGKIIEQKNKTILIGKNLYNENVKIYFVNNNKENISILQFKNYLLEHLLENNEIGLNIYNNILNGNQYLLIKKIINSNCILNIENIQLLNNNNFLINMDIKKKINEKFQSTTIFDFINNEDNEYDYSISLCNNNNINSINRIFEIIKNNLNINKNIKPFNLGIQELVFIKKMDHNLYKKLNFKNIIELKNFAKEKGYLNFLKEYAYEYFYKLEEEAKLIDLFLNYKNELNNNNFEIIETIKNTINQYGYNNCPIHINFKIKINKNNNKDFNTFILNNINSLLTTYYYLSNNDYKNKLGKIIDNKIIFNNNILDRIYLNNLIFTINVQNDNNDFKITKIYGYNKYNKRFINNVSNYGISSYIIDNLNNILKDI